jgi:hypothetical protein
MSDLRIALVAEGPTDYEVIAAALRAVLPRPFVLTLLQPEATLPAMGAGWGGVLKWCQAAGQRHTGSLDADPTLAGFDLLIIHLDADVAHKQYADCGPAVAAMAQSLGWAPLPCSRPCPPVLDTCAQLEAVLASWLKPAEQGHKTLWCLPAQSTGTWLAAALLPADHALLAGAECNAGLESQLALLPKKQRVKKTILEYRCQAPVITAQWEKVKLLCSQAQMFEQALLTK